MSRADHPFFSKKNNPNLKYWARNKFLKSMGFSSYGKYLLSDLWKQIRLNVFKKRGNLCVCCGTSAFYIHHQTYKKKALLGKDISGMFPICMPCHRQVEFDEEGNKRELSKVRHTFCEMKNKRKSSKN